MEQIRLEGLPVYLFAHIYGAEQYQNVIGPRENLMEISYVASGLMRVEQDGQVYEAEPGDLVCNLYRQTFCVRADQKHEHHTVCFAVPFSPAEGEGIRIPTLVRAGEEGARMRALIDEIIRQSILNPGRRLACAGLFLELVDRIDEFAGKEAGPIRHSDLHYVKQAKRYVFDNLTRKITQREIAEELGITPGYLCAVFKAAEGIPLMRFINRAKLEKIRTIMEKDKVRLYRAAEMYGYADPNYVSRLYKSYFGECVLESKNGRKQATKADG